MWTADLRMGPCLEELTESVRETIKPAAGETERGFAAGGFQAEMTIKLRESCVRQSRGLFRSAKRNPSSPWHLRARLQFR